MKKSLGDIVGGFPGGRENTPPESRPGPRWHYLFVMNGFTRPQIIAVFIFRTAALLVIQFNGAGIWIPDPPFPSSSCAAAAARTPRPPRGFLASRAPLSSARLQTLNDKECQRLRNADVSVSKPFPLPRPNSFDGNRHFLDWRITNRFGEFFF